MNQIKPEELLSRYIVDKNYYRTVDHTVKHNAFMPSLKTGSVSVYRIDGLTPEVIWEIGLFFVAEKRKKPLLGRADIRTDDVSSKGLMVCPEPTPHPLHANICKWPLDDTPKMRMIAIELAKMAKLHLRDTIETY